MKNPQTQTDILMHLGDDYQRYLGAIVPPLFQNSLFSRKSCDQGYRYSKISNPTVEIFEKKMAALEHAPRAVAFASGMGAIAACLSSELKAGDHIVVLKSAYYPVISFCEGELKDAGIAVSYAEDFSEEEIRRLVRENTKLFYLESPSSNIFRVLPLEKIAAFAKERGITTVIDNTWASPIFQQPQDLGIDYSVHSASKYIGGHSDVIAGVVCCSEEKAEGLSRQRMLRGASIDPFAAWLLIRSLRTLKLRMEQHQATGLRVARFLSQHPAVKKVFYPGLEDDPGHGLAKEQMEGLSGLMSLDRKSTRVNSSHTS